MTKTATTEPTAVGNGHESSAGELSALELLKKQFERKVEHVTIGGVKLIVVELGAKKKIQYKSFLAKTIPSGKDDDQQITDRLFELQAHLIYLCVTDANGKPLLASPEQCAELEDIEDGAMETLYQVAIKLNPLDQKKTELDAEKN